MEYNLENKLIPCEQVVLDTVAEQSADVDFTLPDYCPDIEKILKCTLTPKIFNRSISGGQLQVEGASIVRVLYCDSIKKNIRCCEQNVPFSASFSLKSTPEQYLILTSTKSEYINCRALSPRRLVIHGAFSLYAKVISKGGVNLYCSGEDANLEVKNEKVSCAALTAFCQEQFTVSEEIAVTNKPAIESILRDSVRANVTECKTIPNKIMINGEINLKMLYLANLDSGETEQLDYLLPFSQVIDCDGVDDTTENNIKLSVLSYDIRLKSDPLSESPLISLDVKLAVTETGYKNSEETIITDAYSTEYLSELLSEQTSLISEIAQVKDTIMNKSTVTVDNSKISKIVDIYNEYCTVTPVMSENKVTLNGKANVCILALDSENIPMYIERTIDFEHECQNVSCNNLMDLCAEVSSISFRLADDTTVEIRAEIKVCATVCAKNTYNCITSVTGYDDKPIVKDNCALIIYYGKKGENMWDIAKRYNTRMDLLLQENSNTGDTLESTQMLLIPTV